MFGKQNTTYSKHPTRASRIAHEKAKQQFPTYDTSLFKPKKSKLPVIIVSVVAGLAIIGIICAILFSCSGCACSANLLKEGQTAEVTIESGSSAKQIGEKLVEAKLIADADDFKNAASQKNVGSQLKPGTYILEGGKSVDEYVDMIVAGPDKYSPKVTVSEGAQIKNIAPLVEEASNKVGGSIKADDFIKATSNASEYVNDYPFVKDAGTNSLEGFLFPKTYSIKSSTTVKELVKMMLDQYKEETKDLDYGYATSKNLTSYDVLTLASIIEKESTRETRGRVASVFYNRLHAHMYLNSDATTAYEVGHDPTPDEVNSHTPYSTYTNYGLPPTPICSPSKASLEAACHPEETKYMYFFFKSKGNGQTEYRFTETYEEHQKAIEEMK